MTMEAVIASGVDLEPTEEHIRKFFTNMLDSVLAARARHDLVVVARNNKLDYRGERVVEVEFRIRVGCGRLPPEVQS